MKYLEILRAQRAALDERRSAALDTMEAVATAALDEKRTLTETEDAEVAARQADIKAIDDEAAALDERIGELEEIEARTKAAAKAPQGRDDSDPLGQPGSIRGNRAVWDLDALASEARSTDINPVHSRAMKALEQVAGINDRQREHVQRFADALRNASEDDADGARRVLAHLVATSSPDYMRAWSKSLKTAIRTGMPDPDSLRVLSRAMSLTDNAGGYAVPLPVDPTLIPNYDVDVNPFRQISTQRTIVTDQLRTVNSTGAAFSWDGEAAEVSDDATTFANIDISVHKAQGLVPFSIEISEDYPGFTEDVRMLIADGRDDLEAAAFATGSGTNQPVGIVTALTGGSFVVASAAADTFAVGDLYAVEEALPAQYRARASWVGNKAIFNDVRQFGTSDSHALWERLGAAQPAQLLGYPVYESSIMDGSITALADNLVLILGDFRNYWIVDRVGLSMELIPHLFATANNRPSGQRAFYCYWRVGADSVNDRAFRMLNVT